MQALTLNQHTHEVANEPTFWVFAPKANSTTTAEQFLSVGKNIHASVLLLCTGTFSCQQKITIELQSGASFDLFGIIVGKKDFSYQLDLRIVHDGPRTKSHAFIRGVLDDNAKAKIKGTIHITENARLSQARFDGKIILFQDHATAVIRPELEIENRDVSASHAASVGHVSAEDLFYLQSRGLPITSAQNLIAKGLLNDVVSRLPKEKPQELEQLLKKI